MILLIKLLLPSSAPISSLSIVFAVAATVPSSFFFFFLFFHHRLTVFCAYNCEMNRQSKSANVDALTHTPSHLHRFSPSPCLFGSKRRFVWHPPNAIAQRPPLCTKHFSVKTMPKPDQNKLTDQEKRRKTLNWNQAKPHTSRLGHREWNYEFVSKIQSFFRIKLIKERNMWSHWPMSSDTHF